VFARKSIPVFLGILFSVTVLSSCVSGLSRGDLANDYYDLGNAYAEIGQDSKALEYYGKAIQLNPLLLRASYNLARIYLKQGRANDALKILRPLITKDPENATLLETEGYALYLLGRKSDARAAYQKAIAINPMSATILNNLAVVDYGLGDYLKAFERVELAQRLAPDNEEILLRAAKYASEAGKTADSIRYYEQFVQKKPEDTNALTALADLYSQQQSYDKALMTYASILKIGSNPTVLFKKAELELTVAEDPRAGLADLESALKAGFKDEKMIAKLIAATDLQSRAEVNVLLTKYDRLPSATAPQNGQTPPK
jgi:tetratricopeptide (TPR) repeat protein